MIHFVVGTKAQLIKVAPVMAALQQNNITYQFIFTGQHQKTIDRLQSNFGIKGPDVVLYKGKDITGIGQMFIWMLRILFKTYFRKNSIFPRQEKNDVVLVHGDTFSTLLGALMGKAARKKVGHIESGLRSFNVFNPFPEELTRIATFYLTDVYYCPGEWALNNLKKHKGEKINTKGNTLYDCLMLAKKRIKKIKVDVPKKKYGVVSLHRFENIFNQKRFRMLTNYLIDISRSVHLLFILHPPTDKKLQKFGLKKQLIDCPGIELRPRYDYFQFIKLVIKSEFVITDGGSNQEEAAYLGKPTLLFRRSTERKEGLGVNTILSDFNKNKILKFLNEYKKLQKKSAAIKASPSRIIAKHLREYR